MDAKHFLSTIPKFGDVYWIGGVEMVRGKSPESKINSVWIVRSYGTRINDGEARYAMYERTKGNVIDRRFVPSPGHSKRT